MKTMAINENKSSINLEDYTLPNTNSNLQVRVPKKILHFSDGTLEYYSEDEDEKVEDMKTEVNKVDTSKMDWGSWCVHKTLETGQIALGMCDYAGETLAYYLGITTPKYQYEIEEYERIQKEQQKILETTKGWIPSEELQTMTQQPDHSQISAV